MDAAAGYFGEALPGLGVRFLDAVTASLAQLEEFPESGPIVFGRVRRLQIRPFKFGVFYVVGSEYIEILRVLHLARDPDRWPEAPVS